MKIQKEQENRKEGDSIQKQQHNIEMIAIENLQPMENQPRQLFDQNALQELAQSIKAHGILQPLIVTRQEKGQVRILAGERRWRAAKMAGQTFLPCLVMTIPKHADLEIALIENIQREDLTPLEEARAFQHLMEHHSYTQEALANRIGKSRTVIANSLRLLFLPNKILADLQARIITAGHARALCGLEDEKIKLKVHALVIKKKLSVRQTEDLIKSIRTEKKIKKLSDSISPDVRYVCDLFKTHLGTKVRITGNNDFGKIEISYYTAEDLERISELILGELRLK